MSNKKNLKKGTKGVIERNIDESWLQYCETEDQVKVITTRINSRSNTETAKKLNIGRKIVDRVVSRIRYIRENIEPISSENYQSESPLYLKGTSTLLDSEGKVVLQWLKTDLSKDKQLQMMHKAFKDLIEDSFKDFNFKIPFDKPANTNEDLICVYPIADMHLGLRSSASITGEDYDLQKGVELLRSNMDRLVASSPNTKKALLVNLGDFVHIDDRSNSTPTNNNQLDVDGDWICIVRESVRILVELIVKLLSKHEQVIVRNAIGNHDPHVALFLSLYLEGWFKDDPRVIIESQPNHFWFYKFGKNLFGVTHGDTVKASELPEIMAADVEPSWWADSKHRVWLTGHMHHEITKEFRTCVVKTFGTLAAKDAWNLKSGYRSKRQIKSFVYHKDKGEIQSNTIIL